MTDLREKSEAVWTAIKEAIAGAMEDDEPLADVEKFFPSRRFREAEIPSPFLATLIRRVEVQEYAANTGIAVMTVQLGASATSFDPEETSSELETIAWALADLFLADPLFAGLVRDTRLVALVADDLPPGEDLPTQSWATVELAWEFDFQVGG